MPCHLGFSVKHNHLVVHLTIRRTPIPDCPLPWAFWSFFPGQFCLGTAYFGNSGISASLGMGYNFFHASRGHPNSNFEPFLRVLASVDPHRFFISGEHSKVHKLTYPILFWPSWSSTLRFQSHTCCLAPASICWVNLATPLGCGPVIPHITRWHKLFLNANGWPSVQEEIWRQVLGRGGGQVTLGERALNTNS